MSKFKFGIEIRIVKVIRCVSLCDVTVRLKFSLFTLYRILNDRLKIERATLENKIDGRKRKCCSQRG